MDVKRKRVAAMALIFAVPLFIIFAFFYLTKIPRPKAPPTFFAEGAYDTVDAKGNKVVDSVYHTIPNARFITQNGDSLELDSLRNYIYVADFFFATCPGICPRLSKSLERVQSAFIKDASVKLVSFSVDPDRDSVPALRKYAANHNAIPGKWYFLRGSHQSIYDIARKGFYVTAKEDEDGGPEAFIHSEKIALVDWNGNIRGYYSGIDSASVNRLMGDIVLLLRQSEQGFSFKKQKKTTKGLFDK